MLLLGSFVRRPPPELSVILLDNTHLAGGRPAVDTVSAPPDF